MLKNFRAAGSPIFVIASELNIFDCGLSNALQNSLFRFNKLVSTQGAQRVLNHKHLRNCMGFYRKFNKKAIKMFVPD